jgi:hypothetical protein
MNQGRSSKHRRRASLSQPKTARSGGKESEHKREQLQQADSAVDVADRKLHELT